MAHTVTMSFAPYVNLTPRMGYLSIAVLTLLREFIIIINTYRFWKEHFFDPARFPLRCTRDKNDNL